MFLCPPTHPVAPLLYLARVCYQRDTLPPPESLRVRSFSRDCPHSYSLQGIVQHILVRNNAPASMRNAPPSLDLLGTFTAPCPVAGCTHLIGAASLEKDYDAEMRLRRSQAEAASAAAAAPGDFEEIDEA